MRCFSAQMPRFLHAGGSGDDPIQTLTQEDSRRRIRKWTGYKFKLLDKTGAVWEEEVVLRVPAPEAIVQLKPSLLADQEAKVYRECESAEATHALLHELARALRVFMAACWAGFTPHGPEMGRLLICVAAPAFLKAGETWASQTIHFCRGNCKTVWLACRGPTGERRGERHEPMPDPAD